MSENLLSAASGQPEELERAPSEPGVQDGRPSGLPDKFWDDKKKQVRLDALIKSYIELERKLSGLPQRSIPDRFEDYKIDVRHELLTPDPDVNSRLHQAGFSNEQVQLVYDLACDRLMPMIAELASLFEAENQIARLENHFGGKERWRETARQVDAWGRRHLPRRVFEALATTFEGVVAIHRMMTGGEPGLARGGEQGPLSDAELRRMMRDPRYWRDQDPIVVEKVRDGFRELYRDRG